MGYQKKLYFIHHGILLIIARSKVIIPRKNVNAIGINNLNLSFCEIILWFWVVIGNFMAFFCRFTADLTPTASNQLPGCWLFFQVWYKYHIFYLQSTKYPTLSNLIITSFVVFSIWTASFLLLYNKKISFLQ